MRPNSPDMLLKIDPPAPLNKMVAGGGEAGASSSTDISFLLLDRFSLRVFYYGGACSVSEFLSGLPGSFICSRVDLKPSK